MQKLLNVKAGKDNRSYGDLRDKILIDFGDVSICFIVIVTKPLRVTKGPCSPGVSQVLRIPGADQLSGKKWESEEDWQLGHENDRKCQDSRRVKTGSCAVPKSTRYPPGIHQVSTRYPPYSCGFDLVAWRTGMDWRLETGCAVHDVPMYPLMTPRSKSSTNASMAYLIEQQISNELTFMERKIRVKHNGKIGKIGKIGK